MASGQSDSKAREDDTLLTTNKTGGRTTSNTYGGGDGSSRAKMGKRPTSSGSSNRNFSTRTGDEDDDEDDVLQEYYDNGSDVSHVELDSKMTYSRLIWSHLLSLLPCLALLLATIMLAYHAPCHIHQTPKDTRLERQTCSTLLNDRVSLMAFVLGIIGWLASHALRPAIWILIRVMNKFFQSIFGISQFPSTSSNGIINYTKLTTFIYILLKTTILECLRLTSILLGNALIFAGLLRIQSLDKDNDKPSFHWNLHWYDPRFTIAVWVAIGWAITEFLVTSWQMFDRLALYEIDFDESLRGEIDIEEEAGNTDYDGTGPIQLHKQHLSDSDTGAEYSDSAATVKAGKSSDLQAIQNTGLTTGINTRPDGRSSPGERLREARKRVINAAGESGFSIGGQSDFNEQQDSDLEELSILREKLDLEMEELNKALKRVELETTFGQSLTSVPITLCTLWRIDGWLWHLGSTLLLSASVTIAQGPLLNEYDNNNHHFSPILFPTFHSTLTSLLFLIGLHTLFTTLWTTGLPTLGFAFVTYASMLAGVGLCVSASARWGLLI